jgi:hypothetical protein
MKKKLARHRVDADAALGAEASMQPETVMARDAICSTLLAWRPSTVTTGSPLARLAEDDARPTRAELVAHLRPLRDKLGPHPRHDPTAELMLFNASEGAFHWVRPCGDDAPPAGGIVFDCGIKSGLPLLKRSLRLYEAESTDPPWLVVVSHYHWDHHSSIGRLAKLAGGEVGEIWIPAIDAYSMALYLRLVVMGALIERGRTVLSDCALTALLNARGKLERRLKRHFPGIEPRRVRAGARPKDMSTWGRLRALALTPPDYRGWVSHPLDERVSELRATLEDKQLREQIVKLVGDLTNHLQAEPDKLKGLDGATLDRLKTPGDQLGVQIVRLLRSPANPQLLTADEDREEEDWEIQMLRLVLLLTSLVPRKDVPRVQVSRRNKDLDAATIMHLGRWDRVVSDATHLFNVSILCTEEPEGGKPCAGFLLTGDADIELWPQILRGVDVPIHGVQVPHHGSKENVLWEAYALLPAMYFGASANKYSTWEHPSERLGRTLTQATITGEPSPPRELFCTNAHDNCGLRPDKPTCTWGEDIIALSFRTDGVGCYLAGQPGRSNATPCPYVGP